MAFSAPRLASLGSASAASTFARSLRAAQSSSTTSISILSASSIQPFRCRDFPVVAVGTVGGILGVEDRPRFREYVVHERLPSYRYSDDFRVGVVLPESGVTYYDVPADDHVTGYRYTYVNDRVVLVDPRTRRVIQIIE